MRQFIFAILLAAASRSILANDVPSHPRPATLTPVKLTEEGRQWVARTLARLSLEEKVGQMINVKYFTDFVNFDTDNYREFRDEMRKYHIGSVTLTVHVDGPVLLTNPPLEVASIANQLQRDSKLSLLVAADFERGLASRVSSVPSFPDAMAFGATGNLQYAERFGAITAEESRAIGVHWNFFPVADVNSNPENPIINTRSFGEDPAEVGDMTAAFIRGARAHGMLTTVKHFPGHGDTGTDSHLGVARVGGNLDRLHAVELPPFKKAIDAGVDSVMVAHLSVPALESDPNKVATISSDVITGVLRKELGFRNVIVTDALDMRGLTVLYPPAQGSSGARAAVDAVLAGNDVILWPTDLDGAFHGIVNAVRTGAIPVSRINASVKRILMMKASLGLYKTRLVDLDQIPRRVSRQADLDFAQQVADDAVTLVRDNGHTLPFTTLHAAPAVNEIFQSNVQPSGKVVAIIITESLHSSAGRALQTALMARRADATVFTVDNTLAAASAPRILQAVGDAERVLVAAYVVPTAAKQVMVDGKLVNSVGLQQATGDLLSRVLEIAAAKTAVVAMGNPYVIESFPSIQTYLCTFSNATSSELSAVKALFGELHPKGKLPVSLPGIANRGDVLPRPGPAPEQTGK